MKKIKVICFLIFLSAKIFANDRAHLILKIYASERKEISMTSAGAFLSSEERLSFHHLVKDTVLKIAIYLDFPREFKIRFGKETHYVFIKPGEQISCELTESNINFNNCVDCDFIQRFQLLKMSLVNRSNVDVLSPLDYFQSQDSIKESIFAVLHENKEFISKECFDYCYKYTLYRSLYNKLTLRRFKKDGSSGRGYFPFVSNVNFNEDHPERIPFYHEFLYEYLSYMQSLSPKKVNFLDIILKRGRIKQYKFADELFDGATLSYLRAYIITKAINNGERYKVIFKDFNKSNKSKSLSATLQIEAEEEVRLANGQPAPELVLETINDKKIKLSDLKDTVVYLVFWASTCKPCIEHFPELLKLQDKFEGEPIKFIYISFDRKKDIWEANVKKYGLKNIQAISDWDYVSRLYGFSSIPYYVLINKEGLISNRFTYNPPFLKSQLQLLIQKR